MTIRALTLEPGSIYAGDSINWLIPLPDYPATAGWVLKYNAVSAQGRFVLVSQASGADHAVSLAKAETAVYLPGTYTLTKYVESATDRITLGEITLQVLPDLAGKTAAFDNRSHIKKVLDAVEAVLEGRASRSDAEYEVNFGGSSRRLKSIPVAELLQLRSTYLAYYRQELASAKLAVGRPSGHKILVRFK